MKPAVDLFGNSELAIRLPALFGHLIYLFFSFKLVRFILRDKGIGNKWWFVLGLLLLNFNPYLLDFFSLARGYGLAMGLLMMSLYYFVLWIKNKSVSSFFLSMTGAFLGILSNFTLLNFYACLVALAGIVLLLDLVDKKGSNWKIVPGPASIIIGFSGVLYWLLHRPIGFLRNNGEFEWGSGSFLDTLYYLSRHSLHGTRYFKMYNVEVFGSIFFILVIAAAITSVSLIIKNHKESFNKYYLSLSILPVMVFLASIVQHYLLGSEYLVNRTALMFIPMCMLSIFLLFVYLQKKAYRPWKKILPVVFGVFCLVHFARSAQLQFCTEWLYDHKTEDMIKYLDRIIPKDDKIKLGVHWIFHPSADYYLKNHPYHFTSEPLVYSKDLRNDDYFDYYYVNPEDLEKLHPSYKLVKQFAWVGCLMKKEE